MREKMNFELGFGTTTQQVNVPEKNLLAVLHPNRVPVSLTGEAEVFRALEEPIGAPPLKEVVGPEDTVVIITSDITRPMPTYKVMPSLLDALYAAGVKAENITLVFALGSHRAHTEDERKKLAGERAYQEIRCIDSDPEDYVHMGCTKMGTPVDVMRIVAEADKRICLGNIEYHYFVGYSGGAKAIMPGVSTRAAIQSNHSRMTDAQAYAGNLEGNPVRADIEEAAAICGVDYIVNVVLNEKKEIIKAFAGDVIQAHRAGCAFLDTLYKVEIPSLADIVIVSQGGAPKDLNLYQTQKALDNAKHAVKQGGIIILVGSCKEGLGEKTFEEWITSAQTSHSLITRIEREFRLGGHKAAAIAMVLENAEIYLVSELSPTFVEEIFMTPMPNLEEALSCAFAKLGPDASVIIMPYGGSTLPKLAQA